MPSIVFTLTTSVRPPIELSDFQDRLALNPPAVAFNSSSDGSLVIDFHSSTSLATPGTGDIASWTQAVIGGPQIVQHDFSALGGETGYLHYYQTKDALVSNKLVSQQITVPSAWSPAELFLNGEKGAFWDYNATACYTDVDRESLASVSGEIASVYDLSGLGNHLRQAISTKRPILGEASSRQYLTFDGSNDWLAATNMDLGTGDELTVMSLYTMVTDVDTTVLRVKDQPSVFMRSSTTQKIIQVDAGIEQIRTATITPTSPTMHLGEVKLTTEFIKSRANGVQQTGTLDIGSASAWGEGRTIYVGAYGEMGNWANCRMYASLVLNRFLTTGEMTDLENWCKTRGNVTW